MTQDVFEIFNSDEFFFEYFEKKPLFVRHTDISKQPGGLSEENFDAYLGQRLYASDIRIVKAGEKISPFNYTYSRGPTHGHTESCDVEVDVPRIMAAYANGYSIILHKMESLSPRVLQTRSHLEMIFQSNVQCNAYLTPSFGQGLATHFDDHDVIILQAYGRKTWTVYEAAEKLPSESCELASVGSIIWSDTLEPGDVLYIPRGFPHFAKTEATSSGHVTFALCPPKISDFLRFCVEFFEKKDPSLRSSFLPSKTSADDVASVLEALTSTINDSKTMRVLMQEFQVKIRQGRKSGTLGSLISINRVTQLSEKSILRVNEAINVSAKENDGKIVLIYGNSKLDLPQYLKPLLEKILTQSEFELSFVPLPTFEQKIKLASKLISEGILLIKQDRLI